MTSHSRITKLAWNNDWGLIAGTVSGQVLRIGRDLVATQVIEVSLDLDFDTVFTEPAPLEALAQPDAAPESVGSPIAAEAAVQTRVACRAAVAR